MFNLVTMVSRRSWFLFAIIFAAIVSYLVTPFVIKLAYKIGAIDVPKDERRVHKKPIPRLGGVSIYISFLLTMIIFGNIKKNLVVFFIGTFIIIGMGIVDDVKEMSAKVKFLIQILAALIVAVFAVRINFVVNPFNPNHYFCFNALAIPLTVFWIVGITNTVNLIDGLDGLAAGISAISCITLTMVLIKKGEIESAFLASVLLGSIIGFLPFNFNPAKIFMGDTGSLFLGFALSVISIEATVKSVAALSVFIPIMTLGIPIFDTTFAIIRRLINRKPIMQADKGHLHHRLLSKGLSQKQTVVILYMMSVLLGLSAYFIDMLTPFYSVLIVIVDIFLMAFVVFKFKILNNN